MLEQVASRRQLLEGVATLVTLGAIAGHQASRPRRAGELPAVTTSYPEIAGYTVQGSGRFTTRMNRGISWINVSDFKFNEERAKQLFTYYESLYRNGLGAQVSVGNEVMDYVVNPKPTNKSGLIFIVPEEAPLPSWAQGDYQGVTDLRPQYPNQPDIAILRMLSTAYLSPEELAALKNEVGLANRTFAAEAANLAFSITTPAGRGYKKGQEIFINSLARLVAARQSESSYPVYRATIDERGASIEGLGEIPFVPYPETDYRLAEIPKGAFSR